MIIDSHCHAWETWPYDPAVPDPATRGRAERLLWEMDQNGVSAAVLISAGIRGNPSNSAYTQSVAAASGGRLLAFPDVDCRWSVTHHRPGAAERLEAAVATRRCAGFTHYLDEKADPSWLVSADGLDFFETAARHNLIASLSCGPSQMPTVTALAERFPQVPFLLHHLGWVPASPSLDREALRRVIDGARLPNLFIKVSGFGYAVADGWNFPCKPALSIAQALCDAYGPRRLIWGSDYPVSQRYMTYRQSLEIVRSHCDFLSGAEMSDVIGGNMRRLLEGREFST
jgi:predicted TIM-barrel fold metal-dependent hydrolase